VSDYWYQLEWEKDDKMTVGLAPGVMTMSPRRLSHPRRSRKKPPVNA
jgi:hypothetical protein